MREIRRMVLFLFSEAIKERERRKEKGARKTTKAVTGHFQKGGGGGI